MRKYLVILVISFWGNLLFGQGDSIPRIVEGEFDWLDFKAKMNAPAFNQKDIVMYLVHQEGYGKLFGDNPDQAWVDGFHFLNFDENRFLDAVFYGEVESKKGPYTMLLMGDTSLSWAESFAARGYVHHLSMKPGGMAFSFRRDAREGWEYWSECSSWWYDHAADSVRANWRVWFVGNSAPANADRIRAFTLDAPTELRWAPEIDDQTGYDWNGDEKADVVGNVVGIFRKGASLLATYEQVDEDGEPWSFVILLDGAQELRTFPKETNLGPGPDGVYIAGWMPTKALGRR